MGGFAKTNDLRSAQSPDDPISFRVREPIRLREGDVRGRDFARLRFGRPASAGGGLGRAPPRSIPRPAPRSSQGEAKPSISGGS